MVAQDATAGMAGTLCDNYAGGGFTDWYLPSIREFSLLAAHSVLIDQILDNDGKTTTIGLRQEDYGTKDPGRYWSSTEEIASRKYAYCFSFSQNYSFSMIKSTTYRVRAIRAF